MVTVQTSLAKSLALLNLFFIGLLGARFFNFCMPTAIALSYQGLNWNWMLHFLSWVQLWFQTMCMVITCMGTWTEIMLFVWIWLVFKAWKKIGCVSRGHLTGASLNVDSVSETVSAVCYHYMIGSIRLYVSVPVPVTVTHFQLVKITGLEKI